MRTVILALLVLVVVSQGRLIHRKHNKPAKNCPGGISVFMSPVFNQNYFGSEYAALV